MAKKNKERQEFEIHCQFSEMRDVVNLQPHPDNPNKHPDRQVALLAKVLRYQGWRSPIQVSSRSGFVVAGHGRLEAAKLGGLASVPVDVQEFQSEADEIAHLLADNRIAELADLDMTDVKELMGSSFDASFDLALTGYDESFRVGDDEAQAPDEFPTVDENISTDKTCPKCGYEWSGG